MEKCNRNDPCHCGSGKKFKKCCESGTLRSKVQVSLGESSIQNVTRSFFKSVSALKKEGSEIEGSLGGNQKN